MRGNEKTWMKVIVGLSIVIPVAVAVLLFMPYRLGPRADWVYLLPHLHGVLNSLTTVFLLVGVYFIKQKNINGHRLMMTSCFVLGCVFLISYVTYHSLAEHTVFGDLNNDGVLNDEEKLSHGASRWIYYALLISHIVLAAVVVPFVLFAFYFAWSNQFNKHKRIVKYTLPIWLYVSITGVLVYWMIKPYYL